MASSAQVCATCNKTSGLFLCEGCEKRFCGKHVAEHRTELAKTLNNVVHHHDLLQKELNKNITQLDKNPLMTEINTWERESIEKIRNMAAKSRTDLVQLLNGNKEIVNKNLESISAQLKKAKEDEDYSEKDITSWLKDLETLKNQLSTPVTARLHKMFDVDWIQRLEVAFQALDKFDRTYGNVKLLENGLVAENCDSDDDGIAVRGLNTYSKGVHRISLKLESMRCGEGMFWGIISQSAEMKKRPFNTPSSYGWASGSCGIVWMNGERHEYSRNSYDGDRLNDGDTIHLILNCEAKKIELEYANKKSSIPVDLKNCPFPWQLNINLWIKDYRIRILQ